MPRHIAWVAATAALFLFAGACARMPKQRAASAEEIYVLEGAVVRLDPAAHTVTVKHSDIANPSTGKVWMKAMTMEFPVPGEAEFKKLGEGQKIHATVHTRDLDYWLDSIRIEAPAP